MKPRSRFSFPWWGFAAWILALVFGIVVYPHLPETVATHFNAAGQANGYMSRLGAILVLPAVMLILILLWQVFWRIDPKKENYEKFWPTYQFLGGLIVAFLACVQIWLLGHAMHMPGTGPRLIPTMIGLLFLLLSNFLPRIQPNWLVGIRTPWTLSSEESWRKTHRLAGNLGFLVGLLMILCAWVLPLLWIQWSMVVIILVWIVAAVVTSYVYAEKNA